MKRLCIQQTYFFRNIPNYKNKEDLSLTTLHIMKTQTRKKIIHIKTLIIIFYLKNKDRLRVSEMNSCFKVSKIYKTNIELLTCKMSL